MVKNMCNKELKCPVKRINKSNINLKMDDNMNINIDINTKNIIKSVVDFINNKRNKEKD